MIKPILCLIAGAIAFDAMMAAAQPVDAKPRPLGGLLCNLDCTEFFMSAALAAGKEGEAIDQYVDDVAGAGVTVLLCNTNARRTNYRSRVWDSFWDGYDPAGPDDQPFLAPFPRSQVRAYRTLIGNMLAVDRQGIDYPARVIERCRHDRVSPWISLRMNDCHGARLRTSDPREFLAEAPGVARQNCTGYFATCLDYAHPEVRDYYMALVDETLERYDVDGLELDFMREPYLFSAGKEAAGATILTAWLGEVRKRVEATAARRGHAIRLGVRVPSTPESAWAWDWTPWPGRSKD